MASDSTGRSPERSAEELARQLQAASEQLTAARDEVAEVGEGTLNELEDALRELHGLFEQYEDSATGSGDFESYMQCRMAVQDHVESLDDDLPEYDRFEDIADRFDARRLSADDFAWARDHLEPVAELVDRLEARTEAREQHATARRAVTDRLEEIEDRLAYLRDLTELGDANLDAPVEVLREPIEEYNQAVDSDVRTARQEWPARDLLEFASTVASAYPLVDLRAPPDDLRDYVDSYDAGAESVETLLEYADYSRSKLDHYVEAPMALKRHVATHRTYLTRLDATPLQIEWPPPSADVLRYRARELVSVVDRVASDGTVAHLHAARALSRRDDYGELRAAARAKVELDAAERERLRNGEVRAEIEALTEERETLESALEADDA
ncbi:MAG: hypothetical protein ABEJ35_04165 [Halobacteriaceae archaeon]